jgi:hemolysin activation/secretion protein
LRALAGLCLVLASAADLAWGQAPQLPADTRPSERPLPAPEFRKPAPEILELPPLAPPDAGRVPFMPRVVVRKLRITGNTAVSEAELAKLAAPYENREITSTDLEELRRQLTLYYVNRGYVNSGAVIPDQSIQDGVIDIRIVEGRLARIDVEGTRHFRRDFFSDRIALHAGPPLNLVNLEQGLQMLLRDPLVASINAQLAPGERPGEAVLKAQVAEAPRYDLGISLDNKLSPSLGEAALGLNGEIRNIVGYGDVLSGALGIAEGIRYDVKLRYRTLVSARDTAAAVYYEKASSKVVQKPFNVLDITSELETVGVQVSHPVYRTPNSQVSLAAALERRESTTTLLGEPFSFSPGVENGKATVSVLRLVQDLVDRGRDQVLAARSSFSFGLDAFGSTVHKDEPDSRFVAWLGQFQWVRRLGERGDQLHFRLNGQLANDALLPIEQFSVGGLDSVRGYRTNQLVRDRGYTGSLEYRLPVFSNPTGWQNLQLALFLDHGGAQNKAGPNPSPSHLTGSGLGFLWNPSRQFAAEIYFAHGHTKLPDQPGHSLQDEAIYFRLIAYPFRPD